MLQTPVSAPPKSRRRALLKAAAPEPEPVPAPAPAPAPAVDEILVPEVLEPVYAAVDASDGNSLTIALNGLLSADLTSVTPADLRTMMETCSANPVWTRKHSQVYSKLAAVTPGGSYDILKLSTEDSPAPVGSKEDAMKTESTEMDVKPLGDEYTFALWMAPSFIGMAKIIATVNPDPYIVMALKRDLEGDEDEGSKYLESNTPELLDPSKAYPCHFTISEHNASKSIQENVDFQGHFQAHDDGVFRRAQNYFRPRLPTLMSVIDNKAGHKIQLAMTRSGVLRCILHDTRTKMTTSFSLDVPMPRTPEDAGEIVDHLRYNFILRASWLHSILKMGGALNSTTLFPVVRELPAIGGKPRLLRLTLLLSNRLQHCSSIEEFNVMCMDDKSVVQEGQITVATYVETLDNNKREDDVVTNVRVDPAPPADLALTQEELVSHWDANASSLELTYFQGFPIQSIEIFIAKLGSNLVEMRIGTGKSTADRPDPEESNVMIFFVNHDDASITLTYNYSSSE